MLSVEEDKTQLILEYRAMEQRIREIHKEFYDWCAVCRDPENHKFSSQYPCETLKALDGEIGSVEPVKLEALDGE